MPGMTWGAEAHVKLLLAVLRLSDVKIDFDSVAKELSTDTMTCTPRAVQEQMKKLRKMAKEGSGDDQESTPKSAKTAARKRKVDGSEHESPAPKKGKVAATGAKKVKQEVAQEDQAEDF